MVSQPSSFCGVEHRRRGTDVLLESMVMGHGTIWRLS